MGGCFKNIPDIFAIAKHFPHQIAVNSFRSFVYSIDYGVYELQFYYKVGSFAVKNDGTKPFCGNSMGGFGITRNN